MNKAIISSFAGFILGAIGGFVGGYYYTKNKYLSLAEKEIDSVRKVYEKHFANEPQIKQPTALENPQTINNTIQEAKASDNDKKTYQNYAGMYGGERPAKKHGSNKSTPYVISPTEFSESEYEAITLFYYSDKVLADMDGNIIHNINELIGPEALSTFGRYTDEEHDYDNVVYVRDDNKKVDYEISWDVRKYSDVKKRSGDKVPLPEDDY